MASFQSDGGTCTILNMSFLTSLRQFIQKHALISPGARVVVGVSGGPDSLALLHALLQLAPDHGWQLHAAYLNHGLRAEAEEEAHFVAELAAAWGIGCTIERADVQSLAQRPGVSVEEAARQARYAFLWQVAARLQASIVAVGHHADDQVETILMHMLRGSGLAGLRGMPPSVLLSSLRLDKIQMAEDVLPSYVQRSQLPDHVRLIRPLLPFSRQDILHYCQQHHLQPRWDLSNLDTTYFRNQLRHEIIPRLRAINPHLTTGISRMAFALQGDYDVLATHRQELWRELAQVEPGRVRLELTPFRALLPGDQRALLRRAISELRPDFRNIRWEHTERVLDVLILEPQRASGGPYTLTTGLVAYLSYDWLDVQEAQFIPVDVPQILQPERLALPGKVNLGPSWHLVAREVAWEPGEAPWQRGHHANALWLPWHIPQPLLVRPRKPGDRMQPFGLPSEKRLKDLMNALKIPRPERTHWPLLVDAHDRILWIVGRRASDLARVSSSDLRAWEILLEYRAKS